MTPLVAEAAKAMLDAGVRDVRNQGVLLKGVNDSTAAQLLDLCFALQDGASITPYYFYMCDMIPSAEHWRVSLAEAQTLQHDIMGYLPGFATPRIVCDVPYVGKRWVHQVAEYDRERGISYWTKNYRTGIERTDEAALDRALHLLRPDRDAAGERAGVVGGAGARSGGGRAAGGDLARGVARPTCSADRRRSGCPGRFRGVGTGVSDDGELRTERLRLRPWTASPADLARLTDLYGREEVTRWLGGPPSVPPDELVARWAALHARDDRYGCWAIERADGAVAGTVLFKPLPNGVGEVEVGWHLHPDSWGTATRPRRPGR